MDGPTLGALPPFNTIGYQERVNVLKALKRPLSGYLGGTTPRGGYWTDRLESEWCNAFDCRYAIPCNSATSGLLAACMAAGVGHGDVVWTTPYSMSATAACPVVLGAQVRFIDIEPLRYSINLNMMDAALAAHGPPKAVIVTNLFGHPAYLAAMRSWCDANKAIMIEDNAQSIFAVENRRYAGTIGHMGVFSLNVHKHLQCGEGGVVCTGGEQLALRLRGAVNHGELSGGYHPMVGLNLRMTEPIAAIACAQLAKGVGLVIKRRAIALAINKMMGMTGFVKPVFVAADCKHSFYVWSGEISDPQKRKKFVHELALRGFPISAGYVKPLNHVFHSQDNCPEADRVNSEIIVYEVCAFDPKAHHLKRMKEIVEYVAEGIENGDRWTKDRARASALHSG